MRQYIISPLCITVTLINILFLNVYYYIIIEIADMFCFYSHEGHAAESNGKTARRRPHQIQYVQVPHALITTTHANAHE